MSPKQKSLSIISHLQIDFLINSQVHHLSARLALLFSFLKIVFLTPYRLY